MYIVGENAYFVVSNARTEHVEERGDNVWRFYCFQL